MSLDEPIVVFLALRDEGFINHTHLVCVNLQRICNVRKDNDFEPGSVEFIRDSFIILVN